MKTVVEVRLAWLFRGLAVAFAVTGATFFFLPDATVDFMNGIGAMFGLPEAPEMAHRFWLSLGTSYMAVVTALAWLIAGDPVGRRPMMVALGIGKATSSLTCLLYFVAYDNFFIYFANFVVDGSLVGLSAIAWLIAGKVDRTDGGSGAAVGGAKASVGNVGGSGMNAAQRNRLAALVEAMVPVGPAAGAPAQRLADDLERYFRGLGSNGVLGLKGLVAYLNLAPVLLLRSGRTAARMSNIERERFLGGMEASRFLLVRAPVHALKLLVMMHYYQEDAAQQSVGMDPSYLREKLAYAAEQRRLGTKPKLPVATGSVEPPLTN